MFFSPNNRLLGDNDEPGEYGTFTQQGDIDEETFGDTRKRREVEKTLLRKLDLRSLFLVLMYTMNYVSEAFDSLYPCALTLLHSRWTATTQREPYTNQRNMDIIHLTRAARLKGLEEDLHMSGTQFNTLISILYVGYVLMQTPS